MRQKPPDKPSMRFKGQFPKPDAQEREQAKLAIIRPRPYECELERQCHPLLPPCVCKAYDNGRNNLAPIPTRRAPLLKLLQQVSGKSFVAVVHQKMLQHPGC